MRGCRIGLVAYESPSVQSSVPYPAVPSLPPFAKKIVPSGSKIKFPIVLPSGRVATFVVHLVERSGVMETQEVSAG